MFFYESESDLPFLVAHLTLLGDDGVTPVDVVMDPGNYVSQDRLLYGNLVSSPHVFRNLQGGQGIYFVFPDVSVRQQGQFRLRVTLLKLPRSGLCTDLFCCTHADHSMTSICPLAQSNCQGMTMATACSLPFDVCPRIGYSAPGEIPTALPSFETRQWFTCCWQLKHPSHNTFYSKVLECMLLPLPFNVA